MAFHLNDSPWLKDVRARCRQQHLLIVERRDVAGLSGNQDRAIPVPSRLKRLVLDRIKRPLKRRRHEAERSRTSFARWAEDQARRRLRLPNSIPVRAVDVSLKGILTFPQFISLVADAAAIVTTRLHVGILGALLDKPTLLVPGDAGYCKIQGIYEYSLKDNAGVELLENPFAKERGPAA